MQPFLEAELVRARGCLLLLLPLTFLLHCIYETAVAALFVDDERRHGQSEESEARRKAEQLPEEDSKSAFPFNMTLYVREDSSMRSNYRLIRVDITVENAVGRLVKMPETRPQVSEPL